MTVASGSFGRLALRGSLLTGLSQLVKIGISFLSVVVLARLLEPEDFGLLASTAPLVAFVALFQNLGLQQAIVQRLVVEETHLNQIFWVTALAGVLAAAAVIALAPLAASFYSDPRIMMLMMFSAPPLILGSLASVPLSLLNRSLRFGSLALNEVLIAFSGFTTAVVAALSGLGYWSLVLAGIVSPFVSLVAAWLAAPYRPGRPTFRIEADLLSFGANLTGFNLVNFFARNVDNVLIGRIVGLAPLGYYDRAYKLLLFPLQNITQPLSRVMIPILSRVQTDKARFRSIYLSTNWMLAFLIMPGIASLTTTANEVILIFFGERWIAVAPIFAWLGIASFAQITAVTNGWIFICQGRTREMFYFGLWTSSTTIISFVVGLTWDGIVGLAAAYSLTVYTLHIPALLFFIQRIGPVKAFDLGSILVLFSLCAGFSWIAMIYTFFDFHTLGNYSTIAFSLIMNYVTAAVFVAAYPPSRRSIAQTLSKVGLAARSNKVQR